MPFSTRVLAATAFVLLSLWTTNAMADKYEFSAMLPEQIEKEIRTERKAYQKTMDDIRQLENGPADKSSAEYKQQLKELLAKAVEQKVNLDVMLEALAEQQKAYGGN